MKKTLLAFSLLAFGSLQLHAAPCSASAVTLGSLGVLGCNFVNGTNNWNLTNFAFTGTNTGLAAAYTPSDINILVSTWGLGFQVTTSRVQGNFSVASPQALFLETSFRIAGITVPGFVAPSTGITQMGATINPPAGAASSFYAPGTAGGGLGGPTTAELRKFVQRMDSVMSGPVIEQLLLANYSDIANGSLTNFYPPAAYMNSALIAPNGGQLVVVDRLDLQAFRTGGFANVVSYTNYFAPAATGIPEPMTFALMGAGLIGLAVLRRRK